MSIFKKKKNYKELYEIELNNRKMYEKRYKELQEENIKIQKDSGIADLRKVNEELTKGIYKLEQEVAFLKEDRARLYIQLDDLRNEVELSGK